MGGLYVGEFFRQPYDVKSQRIVGTYILCTYLVAATKEPCPAGEL